MTDGLTINEAAETTGWSPRMLRYLERVGLVEPARTPKGYRVFGPAELQRLRTLRELIDQWFEAPIERPEGVSSSEEWLRWEQEKHQRLLAPARAA
jgi:MerR family copper efflux transcriptional regulator